ETVGDVTGARQPSGWATRLTPSHSFGRGEDLSDTLERSAGLTITRQSSAGQPAYAGVRGGNPRQLAVMLNGIPIGRPAGLGFDVGGLSANWIEGVEVYRGPAASLYGGGALTGALNLQTDIPDDPGWTTGATLLGGSFGMRGLATRSGYRRDGQGLRLDAAWRRSDGDFPFVDDQGESHRRLNNDHRRVSVAGTGRVELSEGSSLKSTVYYRDGSRGAAGPEEFQESFRRARFESKRLVSTLNWTNRAVASGNWGAIDLGVDLGFVQRTGRYQNPTPLVGGTPVRNHTTYRSTTARVGADAFLEAGHVARADLTLRTESYDSRFRRDTADRLRADRQTAALSLVDEWLLFDRRLSLIGGLRTEIVDGRRSTYLPVIPSAGIVWRTTPWLKLKANAARSFRVPDLDELYYRSETVRGNPELDPERAWQWDVGLAAAPASWPVSASATFFYSDIRETILFLPQTAYLYRAENLEGATSFGAEIASRLDLEYAGARVTYTWLESHLDATPDTQLPHRPAHRVRAESELRLEQFAFLDEQRPLRLSASASYRSRVNLDNFGNLTNRPFWQVDLGASYRPEPWLGLQIEARNVTDNQWGANVFHRPLPGRSIYGSIELRSGGGPSR
ncbi:MAG: TonB-dependent receptor plug domain-containing protein, partial [Bradymonadaceae bacterium]